MRLNRFRMWHGAAVGLNHFAGVKLRQWIRWADWRYITAPAAGENATGQLYYGTEGFVNSVLYWAAADALAGTGIVASLAADLGSLQADRAPINCAGCTLGLCQRDQFAARLAPPVAREALRGCCAI